MIKLIVSTTLLVSFGNLQAAVNLPDPTRPAHYSEAITVLQVAPNKRTEFNLNAVRISPEDRSAIVNGRLVRIGDEIGKAKVKEINTHNVVLDYERKLVTLPLYKQGFSKKFRNSEEEN